MTVRRVAVGLLALLALSSASAASAQAGFLQPRKVAETLLATILHEPHVRTIDTDAVGGPSSAYMVLRLYGLPLEGDCVSGRRAVCSHHYFMSVAGNDSLNESTLYDLGEFGDIEWLGLLDPEEPGTARIRLRVLTYPRDATPLVPGKRLYQVEVVARVSTDAFALSP